MQQIVIADQSPEGKPIASVDMTAFIADCPVDYCQQLVAALAARLAGDDFLDSLTDPDTDDLTERGIFLLDLFVRRAIENDRIPEDYTPRWVAKMGRDADALQTAIVERRVDDALTILHDMVPGHDFLSPAAEMMLAGQRSLL